MEALLSTKVTLTDPEVELAVVIYVTRKKFKEWMTKRSKNNNGCFIDNKYDETLKKSLVTTWEKVLLVIIFFSPHLIKLLEQWPLLLMLMKNLSH